MHYKILISITRRDPHPAHSPSVLLLIIFPSFYCIEMQTDRVHAMAALPRSRLYYFVEQGMRFRVTITLRASLVESWICRVHREFLDRALEDSKCVGLDSEYTDTVKNVMQKNLLPEKRQRAVILQLSVPSETLVFQICNADAVPELLSEFLKNDAIMLWGAAIHRDVQMLEYYGITIPGVRDLQREIPNPTFNYPPGLYALANAYIETSFSKNDPNIAAFRREVWADVPLSFEQVNYAALDARLGFEIARKCFQLAGYNTHVDRLNVAQIE
jgi:hypothetical protein